MTNAETLNLQDYAETLFRECKKIDGDPTKEQIAKLRGIFDNVQLWMDAVGESVE